MQRTILGPRYSRPVLACSLHKQYDVFNVTSCTPVLRTKFPSVRVSPQAVSKGFSSTADEAAEKKKSKIRIKKSKSNTDKVLPEQNVTIMAVFHW